MRWHHTNAARQVSKLIGVSFRSWRTSLIAAAAAFLYIMSRTNNPTMQDWFLAAAIALYGLVTRDAKNSSQDEGIRK